MLYLISKMGLYRSQVESGKEIDELFSGGERIDIYSPPRAIEAHVAIDQRENRVIATESNVFPRQELRPALTHNDVAPDDHLAAEFFYAQPFADAVAAVLNAALSFFMSHDES